MLKSLAELTGKVLLLIVLTLFLARPLHAAGKDFAWCNAAASAGTLQQAIDCYQEIIGTKGYSAAVLYNLANSYALSGKTGEAILYYERALRLAPSDPDILGNLEAVRKSNGLFTSEPSFLDALVQTFSIDSWAMIGLFLAGALTLLLFLAYRYKWKPLPRYGGTLAIASLIAIATAAAVHLYHSYNPCVVLASNASLLLSPFASAEPVSTISEGRLIYPWKQHQQFYYAADESGHKGWIAKTAIKPVIPGEPDH